MTFATSIVWFRLDLRLADNPALHAAVNSGGTVVPVFIWSPAEEDPWPPGAASRWWLHQSLKSLEASLRARGSRLVIRKGPTLAAMQLLVRETGATAVFWNRRYEPALIARDTNVQQALLADGVPVVNFNSALLYEPWEIKNSSGKPFQVFTPFWRACLAKKTEFRLLPRPKRIPTPTRMPESLPLAALGLEPKFDWAAGFREAWCVGEAGAAAELKNFLSESVQDYQTHRDRPGLRGTSRLSPHLHFGEISPRQIWMAAWRRRSPVAESYLRQLIWREFAHHLVYHFPRTTDEPLRPAFAKFPWRKDAVALRAWQRGRTGFPIVDAGMRELRTTGWMHNRVRMIAASFLVKDLLIPWQDGARWFWDTLVDADLANNTLGWQWVAGCGADAAPYFRIFNPTAQAERFDAQTAYVRRWLPELGTAKYLSPIVDHNAARRRALRALAEMKA